MAVRPYRIPVPQGSRGMGRARLGGFDTHSPPPFVYKKATHKSGFHFLPLLYLPRQSFSSSCHHIKAHREKGTKSPKKCTAIAGRRPTRR